MITRCIQVGLIFISLVSCKDEEVPDLPEKTANGNLTIDGTDYSVNYGMIRHLEPDGNRLHNFWLVLSDYPIGWDELGRFYASSERSFSIIISLKNFDNTLRENEYNYWKPEDNPEPFWWEINHLSTKDTSLNHPNAGKIVLSELEGNYSILLDLKGDVDKHLAEIKGIVYGPIKIINE